MNTKSHAIELMTFAHGMLNKALESIPADKATFQPFPKANHVVWTYGHLSTTYAWLAGMIDAKANAKLPDSYNGLFGGKSKPVADAKHYPPLAEVKKHYDNAYALFFGLIQKLPEGELWSKTATDSMGFASSKIDAAYKCAWHDGWHLGQIADIRRHFDVPSLF